MKKRFLGAFVAFAMLLGSLGAFAAPPSDVVGEELGEAVNALIWLDVVGGYPDGSFRPEVGLTRAEACKLFAEAMSLRIKSAEFNDIRYHWAESYIDLCVAAGLIEGYEDGTFRPNSAISMLDFAKMALLMVGDIADDDDVAEIAAELGLLQETAELEGTITRGEAAIMLFEAMRLPVGGNEAGVSTLATLTAAKVMQRGEGLMRWFTLVGQAEDGKVNGTAVEDGVVLVFDAATGGYYAADITDAELLYNFVALYDIDGNGAADTVIVVNREDGEAVWDSNLSYGEDFEAEYSIPYGERMLGFANRAGYLSGAVEDYSNITAAGDLENSLYWPTYDWYNSTSTDTLTYLTHFKTTQQASGWACGTTSALMAMEWYGIRDGLNENDLSALRDKMSGDNWVWGGYTDTQMLINMFTHLNKMAGEDIWGWTSTYDFVDADGNLDGAYLSTAWIKETLAKGIPILIGWDDWGGHWQLIIGYDDMGTEIESDDVLILADPYDTTDHLNDGYLIHSYQRFVYNWTQGFDRDFGRRNGGSGMPVMFVPYPAEGFDYQPVYGDGLVVTNGSTWANEGNVGDEMLMPYGLTEQDLDASGYEKAKKQRGENGLAGPASARWYRAADVVSPYYAGYDFFNKTAEQISASLVLLEQFQTSQQASEWSCGPASLRMALNWFGTQEIASEFELAGMRENDREGATTLGGMIEILETLNETGGDWAWISSYDMGEDWDITDDLGLDYGEDGGLIPYFIKRGIPVVIGWNEWGGHWQVIIGFDDMGTDDTQDDVIILADPYDTTDHCQDGYVIESYERLVYGWTAAFDGLGSEVFLIAAPSAVLADAGF